MLDFIQQNKKIYKAFTLAEVLITLLIIGAVASIVVPNLINDSQDAEFKAAWKKAYANIDLSTRRIILDNAGTFQDICLSGDLYQRNNCLKSLFANYFNHTKQCNALSGLNNCFVYSASNSDAAIVLNDGIVISFQHYFPSCSGDGWGQWCSKITVDVNGQKKPNIVGQDIFGALIFANGLVPIGSVRLSGGMQYINCPNSSSSHWTCSAKYLYN